MDKKPLQPLYPSPQWVGSKSGIAKHVLSIICEGEMDVLQAAGRGVRAACLTGRVRTWPGRVGGPKAWSRKRPRWYRRQVKRVIVVDS